MKKKKVKKPIKLYNVDIEFEIITIRVRARGVREAKNRARAKLCKMNPDKFIKKSWPDRRSEISVEEA